MTIIVSTHRLSLLSMVDRLLLFEKGRLVADGPRDKVIALLQGAPVSAAAPAPAAAPVPVPVKTPQPIVTVSGIRTSAAV
jgi:ATP-binding cassette subfamily C protein LapB